MKSLFLVVILLPVSLFSQDKKVVDLADILDDWILSDSTNLFYENLEIVTTDLLKITGGKHDDYDYHLSKYLRQVHGENLTMDSLGRIIINKNVKFRNCSALNIFIDGIYLKSLSFENFESPLILLDSVIIETLDINQPSQPEEWLLQNENSEVTTTFFYIGRSTIDFLKADQPGLQLNVSYSKLENVRFTGVGFQSGNSMLGNLFVDVDDFITIFRSYQKDTSKFSTEMDTSTGSRKPPIPKIEKDAHFESRSFYRAIPQYLRGKDISFEENVFPNQVIIINGESYIRFYDNVVGFCRMRGDYSEIGVSGNQFISGFGIDRYLTEMAYDINWKDIDNKIRITKPRSIYSNQKEIDIEILEPTDTAVLNYDTYYEVSQVYKRLIEDYKNRGKIDDMNSATVQFKEIENVRLGNKYSNDRSFGNLVRWKLNGLVGIFVRHGTDPGRAIIISVYIIFFFAVFYMFFPSEWDVRSKPKLIKDFRDFINKNDKGYSKPLLRMIGGFLISALNAITLSLNSFVTLGFGNIPTKGVARYVCIVQGFIGWFLLSIFTVALISQVMI